MAETATTKVILITGPVGSGKTSLLNALLELRPSKDQWSVLINDTGKTQVVDPKKPNVQLQTVWGACGASCSTGVPMRTAVLRVLKQQKPNVFLIELSTLARPTALKELLLGVSSAHVTVVATEFGPQRNLSCAAATRRCFGRVTQQSWEWGYKRSIHTHSQGISFKEHCPLGI